MFKKRCAKEAQKEKIKIEFYKLTSFHCYPDKVAITNLFNRGYYIQLKGGYKI